MSVAVQQARKRSANTYRNPKGKAKVPRDDGNVKLRPILEAKQRILKRKLWFAWLALLPVCLFSLVVTAEIGFTSLDSQFAETSHFRWLVGGILAALAAFPFMRNRDLPMLIYVFAHEWTHMLAAKICLAEIYDWSVTSKGGWVDTNKSNTFISLAPYFVPIYTIVALLGFAVWGLFCDLSQPFSSGPGQTLSPSDLLYFTVGLTWCHHVCYTLKTLRGEQSDLVRNGEFFSVLLIVTLNLWVVVSALIIVAPDLEWADAWECVVRTGRFGIENVWRSLTWLLSAANHEVQRIPAEVQNWGDKVAR